MMDTPELALTVQSAHYQQNSGKEENIKLGLIYNVYTRTITCIEHRERRNRTKKETQNSSHTYTQQPQQLRKYIDLGATCTCSGEPHASHTARVNSVTASLMPIERL